MITKFPREFQGGAVRVCLPISSRASDFASAVNESRESIQETFAYARASLTPEIAAKICDFAIQQYSYVCALGPGIKLNARCELTYWVFNMQSNTLLGVIALRNINEENGDVEIGYWIRESERKRGYARNACTVVVDWIIGTRVFKRVTLVTHKANVGSIALAVSLGFVAIEAEEKNGYIRYSLRVCPTGHSGRAY